MEKWFKLKMVTLTHTLLKRNTKNPNIYQNLLDTTPIDIHIKTGNIRKTKEGILRELIKKL